MGCYTKDKKAEVKVSMSYQDKNRLKEYACKYNTNMSDVVRQALLLLYQEEIEINE